MSSRINGKTGPWRLNTLMASGTGIIRYPKPRIRVFNVHGPKASMLTNTLRNRGMIMAKESIKVGVCNITKVEETTDTNCVTISTDGCSECVKLQLKLATLEKLCEDLTQRNVALRDKLGNRLSPSQKRKGNRDGT